MSGENIAFTEQAIADARKRPFDLKSAAITEYLGQLGRLGYDFTRKLWLVNHPSQSWQIAEWITAENLADEERAAIAVSQIAKAFAAGDRT